MSEWTVDFVMGSVKRRGERERKMKMREKEKGKGKGTIILEIYKMMIYNLPFSDLYLLYKTRFLPWRRPNRD